MNHTIHACDVDATRCDICSDQRHALTMLEAFHGSVTTTLGQSAMEGLYRKTVISKIVTNSVDACSSSTEDNGSAALSNKFRRDVWFLGVWHQPKVVCHALHAHFFWSDFDGDWIGLVITDKIGNFVIECGAKENCLSVLLTRIKNLANRFHEPHISHSICFIKHNNRNIVKSQRASLHQIDQATRTSHKHIDTTVECTELLLVGNTPIHRFNIQLQIVS
tara:strand:- start:73 stop:732 length:660 start_codon:yes stop_codon:yes gene_type:complete